MSEPKSFNVSEIESNLDAVEIIEKWYAANERRYRNGEVVIGDDVMFEQAREFIANYFRVTSQQALFLMAIFVITNDPESDYGNNTEASFRQISRKLNMVTTEMFRHISDFDNLIDRGILITDDEINKTRQSFRLSAHVTDVMLLNIPYVENHNNESQLGLSDFLKKQRDHVVKCSKRSFPSNRLIDYAQAKYTQLSSRFPVVRYINELNITTQEKILFFETCGSTTFSDGKVKVLEITDIIFHNVLEKKQFLRSLSDGESLLVKEDLLDIESGEFASEMVVSLSEKALELYLGDEVDLYSKKKRQNNVTCAEDITPRQLFFNTESHEQLSEFESMLHEDNFPELQKKLKDSGMGIGLIAMLYGGPGTGKTESVMQIARRTRRKIIRVDIASVKSMWMGESEKLIKKVFVSYNALVKREKVCPILLFNEADAIFLKRKTGDLRGAENALNAMQNIILEEMENFNGIMIATTNLVRNLDSAFERRFLFKIKLDNPTPEVKQKIWADRLPRFSESEFAEISSKYDFSGGEIDNIIRKLLISEVIEGSIPSIEKLEILCQQEKFHQNSRRPIGFRQSV